MGKQPAVYIMANRKNGALYTGVTSSLLHRVHQHRERLSEGFARRHGCKRLVWYELHADMPAAIAREKQLKGASRRRKIELIEAVNPEWRISTPQSPSRFWKRHCEPTGEAIHPPPLGHWIASSLTLLAMTGGLDGEKK